MFHRLYGFTSFCQANASAPRFHSFLPLASLSPFFPSRHIIAKHTTIVKQIINVFATDTTLCTSFPLLASLFILLNHLFQLFRLLDLLPQILRNPYPNLCELLIYIKVLFNFKHFSLFLLPVQLINIYSQCCCNIGNVFCQNKLSLIQHRDKKSRAKSYLFCYRTLFKSFVLNDASDIENQYPFCFFLFRLSPFCCFIFICDTISLQSVPALE